jgi:hypothetical protein
MVFDLRFVSKCFLLALVPSCLAQDKPKASVEAGSRQTQIITIVEPGKIRIEEMFRHANLVAIVKIVSGDTEHYQMAVYKAVVVTAFKGAQAGQTVYFGPYIGLGLGREYLAFFLEPRSISAPLRGVVETSYGEVGVHRIMHEGYGILELDYTCVFKGENSSCDYGFRISPEKLSLPKRIRLYPDGTSGGGGPHAWVKRDRLLTLVEMLKADHNSASK